MLSFFRLVALVEGVSTLALFLVAMPLKYLADWSVLVPPVGMFHGVAFLAYLAVMIVAFIGHRVGPIGWLRATLAAFIPFGTFLNDGYVARLQARGA